MMLHAAASRADIAAARAGYFLRFFLATAFAGLGAGFGFGFSFGAAGRTAAFTGARFDEEPFATAVFLPCPPDPPLTGFPSASWA